QTLFSDLSLGEDRAHTAGDFSPLSRVSEGHYRHHLLIGKSFLTSFFMFLINRVLFRQKVYFYSTSKVIILILRR
ncbi:hypothetical protein, partial [Vibrio mangrovi]|uniref:hypothetical protein n=1 Tax=Vibrio mangrovi TaxID=474394 RepID=UPI001F1EE25D